MDSDSAKASLESIKDDSECVLVSNEPNLTGTCGDSSVGEERGGGEGVTDVNSSAAASELVPPEPVSLDGNGEGAVLNSVPEISDVVEGCAPVDVVSSELSPAVTEVGGVGEENAAFNVQEMDSVDGVAAAVEVVPLKPSSVVGEGGEEERAASIVKEGDFVAEGSDSQANLSGDRLEENKQVFMEEEPPSHDLSGYEVNEVDSLNAEEKREDGEQVVCGGMAGEESSQAIESELGQNTESEKDKVDVMEEETTAQAASLVNEIEIPDDKEVACVTGFTEIPSQDKGLDNSVRNSGSEFVEEEPPKELQIGEGTKDLTDGDAKEGVDVTQDAMDIQALKKSEEEEKVDGAAVSEIETKPQEVDDVATEVSDKSAVPVDISSAVVTQFAGETSNDKETIMDDVKEDVEKDPEAGKSVDVHVPKAAEEVESDVKYSAGIEKEGDGMSGAGEAGQTVDMEEIREETQELSEELAKVDETKISEVSQETETMIGDEDQEKDDDMTDLVEDVETHGDSLVADIKEGREDHDDMGVTEMTDTQEGTVMGKVDGTKIAEVSEETETRIEDETQEKDDVMTDVVEDVETHGDSSVADIEEGRETHEEMTETQEESVMAEMGDEEPEEVEEDNKSAGGKRKRGRNTKTVKGTGKKKEEDVCFMCFDGGDLVLCDRR